MDQHPGGPGLGPWLEITNPPGRLFLVSPSHTLADLGTAIDLAFARWDISHHHLFRVGEVDYVSYPDEPAELDSNEARLGDLRLEAGSEFLYVFDPGDGWKHECTNPLAEMEPVRNSGARRRGLTGTELEALRPRLEAAQPKDRAEVALMLHTGFRTGDVARLKVEDIDFDGRRIRCRQGKGGKDGWLPLSDVAAAALQQHLRASSISAGWCFTGPNGHMTSRGVYKAWKRVAGEATGLPAHSLRHSYATALLRGGNDANTVRRLMRHGNLATTQQYIDDDPDAEREAIDRLDRQLQSVGRWTGPTAAAAEPPEPDRSDLEAVYAEMVERLSPYLDRDTEFTLGFEGGTTVKGWRALAETLRYHLDRHPEDRDAPRPGPLVYEPEDGPAIVIPGHTYGLLMRFADTAPPRWKPRIVR